MDKVTFTLADDAQVYSLGYDFNEIVDAEGVTGLNLLRAISSLQSLTARELRGLLYALLKSAHPQVLVTEAGALLSRDGTTVMQAIAKVLGAEQEESIADASITSIDTSTAPAD